MRKLLGGLILAAMLAACGQSNMTSSPESGASGGADYAVAPPPAPPPMVAEAPADADGAARGGEEAAPGAQAGTPQPNQPAGPTPVLYLAYSYRMSLEVPTDRLVALMDQHIRACQDAGPRLCQLVGSDRGGDPESHLYGNINLRGEPAWLATFRANVTAQTEDAGGQLMNSATNTEDLTRQIVDTEARLRAMTALRDRLQRLLESRPGRLADLLEVERELARVQGEIDALQSGLAVMRTRVAMSDLVLSYQSESQPLRGDTFRPLTEAFAGFLGWIVMGLAAIVTLIAVLLPWALVLGLIGWLALKWRRRNGGRFLKRKEPPAPVVVEAPPPPT